MPSASLTLPGGDAPRRVSGNVVEHALRAALQRPFGLGDDFLQQIPGTFHVVFLLLMDCTRFMYSGGGGGGAFEYHPKTDKFRPADTNDKPPQANDAKCGFGCHTIVQKKDYVFTEYGSR